MRAGGLRGRPLLTPRDANTVRARMRLSGAGGADPTASRWVQAMRPTPASATLMAGAARRQVRLPDADDEGPEPRRASSRRHGGTGRGLLGGRAGDRRYRCQSGIGATTPTEEPRLPRLERKTVSPPSPTTRAGIFPVRCGVPQRHRREPARRHRHPIASLAFTAWETTPGSLGTGLRAQGIVGRIQAMLEINIKAPFDIAVKCLSSMREVGRESVVNITTMATPRSPHVPPAAGYIERHGLRTDEENGGRRRRSTLSKRGTSEPVRLRQVQLIQPHRTRRGPQVVHWRASVVIGQHRLELRLQPGAQPDKSGVTGPALEALGSGREATPRAAFPGACGPKGRSSPGCRS